MIVEVDRSKDKPFTVTRPGYSEIELHSKEVKKA